MDPIAELLSQLSSVRSRAAAAQSVSSQLQQLEMQLQSTRQQLERLPRQRTTADGGGGKSSAAPCPQPTTILDLSNQPGTQASRPNNSQYLLSRFTDTQEMGESERQSAETERADRSLFVQELLLSTLAENLSLSDDEDS